MSCLSPYVDFAGLSPGARRTLPRPFHRPGWRTRRQAARPRPPGGPPGRGRSAPSAPAPASAGRAGSGTVGAARGVRGAARAALSRREAGLAVRSVACGRSTLQNAPGFPRECGGKPVSLLRSSFLNVLIFTCCFIISYTQIIRYIVDVYRCHLPWKGFRTQDAAGGLPGCPWGLEEAASRESPGREGGGLQVLRKLLGPAACDLHSALLHPEAPLGPKEVTVLAASVDSDHLGSFPPGATADRPPAPSSVALTLTFSSGHGRIHSNLAAPKACNKREP